MSIFKNYPRGVLALSSIEMWERFSFYTMQSILVLYAAAAINKGGLGWSNADAMQLTGIYGALVYASPLFGGWIADKILGNKLAVLLGSFIMMCGHGTLAIRGSVHAMYIGLLLLVIGCGLMKPSISAMVGEFYARHDEANKESGFAIFYMSINIGGFFGPLVAGVVSDNYGYSAAFGTAAFGLLIAIINYFICRHKSLKDVGNLRKKSQEVNTYKWTRADHKRFWTFVGLSISNIFWNVIYALPYGLLTLYADKNIGRTIWGWQVPSTWFFGMYGGMIIILSPLMAMLYQTLDQKTKFNFTISYKLGVGYILLAIACVFLLPLVTQIGLNPHYVGSCWYLVLFYLFFAISELITVPVLLSAATTFAAPGYSATLVSLNMAISWAIGAYLGGEFGALTQSVNPALMFKWVIGLCFIFMVGHILSNRKIENIINAK
jgi:POT family proton-dependent oligopeptide transporter